MESLRSGIETGIALLLLALGLSYLLRTSAWIGFLRDLAGEPWRLFPLALGLVAAGAFIVATYDDWSTRTGIFITALGWLMLLEGSAFLLWPRLAALTDKLSTAFLSRYLRLGGLLLVAVGLMLLIRDARQL